MTVRIISAAPIGRAAARQTLEISSAGVVMKVSSDANSYAGSTISSRKASAATIASTSRKARVCDDAMPTKAVMRMCSPSRKAMTEPSIASHRNRMEASSSDQMIGSWKT